jgi:ribosomal protein L15
VITKGRNAESARICGTSAERVGTDDEGGRGEKGAKETRERKKVRLRFIFLCG